MSKLFQKKLIAPCGMNCGICASYLARKNDAKKEGIYKTYCTGCRSRNKKCAFLKSHCKLLTNKEVKYCYECPRFPCKRLIHLDKRYKTKYHMSEIANLESIKKDGIEKFFIAQEKIWKCPKCGGIISCHNGLCFKCDIKKLQAKKKKYSWED
jgi:hypothetical protein